MITSLANAAAARRPDFFPFDTVPQGLAGIAAAAATPPGAPAPPVANAVNTSLNVLFGYIPGEILTLYVAVLAALQEPDKVLTHSQWTAFWSFLVATPIVFWLVYAAKVKAAQKPLPVAPSAWPVWEMLAATIAYCAWAFALPNTPFTDYAWYSSALAGIVVLVVSTALGLLAPFFQRPLQSLNQNRPNQTMQQA